MSVLLFRCVLLSSAVVVVDAAACLVSSAAGFVDDCGGQGVAVVIGGCSAGRVVFSEGVAATTVLGEAAAAYCDGAVAVGRRSVVGVVAGACAAGACVIGRCSSRRFSFCTASVGAVRPAVVVVCCAGACVNRRCSSELCAFSVAAFVCCNVVAGVAFVGAGAAGVVAVVVCCAGGCVIGRCSCELLAFSAVGAACCDGAGVAAGVVCGAGVRGRSRRDSAALFAAAAAASSAARSCGVGAARCNGPPAEATTPRYWSAGLCCSLCRSCGVGAALCSGPPAEATTPRYWWCGAVSSHAAASLQDSVSISLASSCAVCVRAGRRGGRHSCDIVSPALRAMVLAKCCCNSVVAAFSASHGSHKEISRPRRFVRATAAGASPPEPKNGIASNVQRVPVTAGAPEVRGAGGVHDGNVVQRRPGRPVRQHVRPRSVKPSALAGVSWKVFF